MVAKFLEEVENFPKFQQEVLDLIEELNLNSNQISCQNTYQGLGNWTESIGRIDELAEQDETKYTEIPDRLKGTEIERLIKKFNGYRARIMLIHPRTCYSVHQDPKPRIHIPVKTNNQAYIVWPKNNTCVNLKEGKVYFTDTTKPHTAFNGHGDEVRVHLVMIVDQ